MQRKLPYFIGLFLLESSYLSILFVSILSFAHTARISADRAVERKRLADALSFEGERTWPGCVRTPETQLAINLHPHLTVEQLIGLIGHVETGSTLVTFSC